MTLASKYARTDIGPAELRSPTLPMERTLAAERGKATPAPGEAAFVITLCSMAAPISLPQPRSPQLCHDIAYEWLEPVSLSGISPDRDHDDLDRGDARWEDQARW